MQNFFLGIVEITLGMSLLIPLILLPLRMIGGKFTAKCRCILWTIQGVHRHCQQDVLLVSIHK